MGKLHYLCLFTRRYSFLQIISNIYLNFLSFNSWLQGSAITASNASIPTQSTRFRTGNLLFWHHCSQRNICIKIMPVPKFTLFEHFPPPLFTTLTERIYKTYLLIDSFSYFVNNDAAGPGTIVLREQSIIDFFPNINSGNNFVNKNEMEFHCSGIYFEADLNQCKLLNGTIMTGSNGTSPSYNHQPSVFPSESPSLPSRAPSDMLSVMPSPYPSVMLTRLPSVRPSISPTTWPSALPSELPSYTFSGVPSASPRVKPIYWISICGPTIALLNCANGHGEKLGNKGQVKPKSVKTQSKTKKKEVKKKHYKSRKKKSENRSKSLQVKNRKSKGSKELRGKNRNIR